MSTPPLSSKERQGSSATTIYSERTRPEGGVYLWQNREAAEVLYSDDRRQRIAERFGAPPTIEYFDTPLIIDNAESAG
ncbi:hypothetical protein [Microvirga makkahensis]|uniref:hypothetical protein n=1 Tax=Microvirga makkahensis TaxID=1128670 RepID=UPI0013703EDF|nr:hypothetical protein [Microvirga makkahensis]